MKRAVAVCIHVMLLITTVSSSGRAEEKQVPGITDNSVTFGSTSPFSGPLSSFSAISKAQLAYLTKINASGGIHGRSINLIARDDAFQPAKSFEQTRRLVESDNVFAIFGTVGTPANVVVQKYLTSQHVPQIFITSGAARWNDPKQFPWSVGWQPSYQAEGAIYVKYILEKNPSAKIVILYQNDDAGKDYLIGAHKALAELGAKNVIKEVSYEVADPTIDSQLVNLAATGADVFLDFSGPKFAAQAIRKSYEIGWKPLHFITSISSSVGATLKPAGFEQATGIITAAYLKDPADPVWATDPGVHEYADWMKTYYPDGNLADSLNVVGYSETQTLVHVLESCGRELTRESFVNAATHIHDLSLPMLLPGIFIQTAPDNYALIRQMRLQRFDGTKWVLFGETIEARLSQ